ncbi:MAG TPA: UbiA family prenyltransferase [Candidatus Limnocylindrales bacterium]|nr:UbiA family prenyltransferase [Candidatus Limnocylindrales bacterium]
MFAGAEPATAVRLGVAMTALQFSIGTANDAADAERDAGRPDKPIPAGLVARRTATWAAVAFAVIGLALTVPSGPATVAVGGLGLGVGLVYDLRFRGTAASWLPFAIGIPLLPVYAWLGATGGLPPAFAVLVPTAVVAGAGLAIANALADVDVDRRSGAGSVALALGPRRAWMVHAVLLGLASAVAVGSIPILAGVGERAADIARIGAGIGVALVGVALIAIGVALARPSRPGARGWEVEAVGLTAVAVGWIVGVDVGG